MDYDLQEDVQLSDELDQINRCWGNFEHLAAGAMD
jgi:hypothetical protein